MKFFISLNFLFFLLLLSCKSVIIDDTVLIEKVNKVILNDTIPFKLTAHNNISIESILNNLDTLALMFHTDIHSISLTPEATMRISNPSEMHHTTANSWTGSKDVSFIENNKLQIAQLDWVDQTVWLDLLSGPETDGKFGPNLFANKIIEINYDENIIVLHSRVDQNISFNEYEKFMLSTNKNESLFVEGQLAIGGDIINHKFMLHSGYGGTLILDDQFCKDNRLITSLEILEEKDLKDSFGNIIKTKKAKASVFKIGTITFPNMPISYFDSPLEIQKTSIIGGDLLKRFNILLDTKNLCLYLKPNKFTQLTFS